MRRTRTLRDFLKARARNRPSLRTTEVLLIFMALQPFTSYRPCRRLKGAPIMLGIGHLYRPYLHLPRTQRRAKKRRGKIFRVISRQIALRQVLNLHQRGARITLHLTRPDHRIERTQNPRLGRPRPQLTNPDRPQQCAMKDAKPKLALISTWHQFHHDKQSAQQTASL